MSTECYFKFHDRLKKVKTANQKTIEKRESNFNLLFILEPK